MASVDDEVGSAVNLAAMTTELAPDPFKRTLEAATRQPQTVTTDGTPVARALDGTKRFNVPTHVDDRGFLV